MLMGQAIGQDLKAFLPPFDDQDIEENIVVDTTRLIETGQTDESELPRVTDGEGHENDGQPEPENDGQPEPEDGSPIRDKTRPTPQARPKLCLGLQPCLKAKVRGFATSGRKNM
jgi:hypothetical protein